jgi:hypothetical protein
VPLLIAGLTFAPVGANAIIFIQNDVTPLVVTIGHSFDPVPIGGNQIIKITVQEQSGNSSQPVPAASISGVIINSSESGLIANSCNSFSVKSGYLYCEKKVVLPVQSSFEGLTDSGGNYHYVWATGQRVLPGSYSVVVYISRDGYQPYLATDQFSVLTRH